MNNAIEKGFLDKYKLGRKGEISYINLSFGMLRLEYSREEGLLFSVSFILDEEESISIGEKLEFDLSDLDDPCVTFIPENAVSGLQWRNGAVYLGNAYDDEVNDKLSKRIELEEWVDACIAKMINPSEETIEEHDEKYDKEYD